MKFSISLAFFALLCSFAGCTVERAEEQIIARHVNGVKKTSIWVYPDGTILKRNEWYNDGIKELEIPYKNNMPNGEFKRWTGFGDVAMIGSYKDGLRDSKWTSYYQNKKVEAIRYYKDDHPVGDWEGFHHTASTHDEKVKSFEEHYNDKGDSIGVWKKWHSNGKPAMENSCFGTTDVGVFKQYAPDGALEFEQNCKQGIKDGLSDFYYPNGKTVQLRENWKLGKLDGERVFYYGNSDIQKKEFWKEGHRDSVWLYFDDEGNIIAKSILQDGLRTDFGICGTSDGDKTTYKVCAESTFVRIADDDLITGTLWHYKKGHVLRYEEVWDNGQIMESRSFYPDSMGGQKASEGFWQSNQDGQSKRHGIWRNWYKSGILKDSLTYVNGERIGDQFSYDSTGKLTIHKTEHGKNRPVIMHLLDERRGSAGSPTLTKDEREKTVTH